MSDLPADDVDRWSALRKASLDGEILRQVEALANQDLPALKYAGAVFVNLEDVALNRVGPKSVILEIDSHYIDHLDRRANELQMSVLTYFYGLFKEFGAPDLCEMPLEQDCNLGESCCMKAVWSASRTELLCSIAGYVTQSNLAEVALASIVETHVLELFDRHMVRCASRRALRDLPR
jgi:hypothetical protein